MPVDARRDPATRPGVEADRRAVGHQPRDAAHLGHQGRDRRGPPAGHHDRRRHPAGRAGARGSGAAAGDCDLEERMGISSGGARPALPPIVGYIDQHQVESTGLSRSAVPGRAPVSRSPRAAATPPNRVHSRLGRCPTRRPPRSSSKSMATSTAVRRMPAEPRRQRHQGPAVPAEAPPRPARNQQGAGDRAPPARHQARPNRAVELAGIVQCSYGRAHQDRRHPSPRSRAPGRTGGAEGTRTPDPHTASVFLGVPRSSDRSRETGALAA